MPFYEYQCQRCGHHLEAMQRVSDKQLRKCPKCGKTALTRLMSAPVFRLKGGGWYETDFKSDGEGQRNLADKPDPAAAKNDKKDAAKDAGTKEGTPKEGAPKDGAAKDGGPKEAQAKEAPAKESSPKDSATKESAPAKDTKKINVASRSASKKGRRSVRKPASRRR
jgi:putative FmdB family regulatory protein